MASIYGERHDIFVGLHTNSNTKLDALLAKNTEIDLNTDTIEATLDASLVKQTNLETLITSTNSKIDIFDAVLDASLVKQTNLETLITSTNSKIDTFDAVLDASLVKQTNIETLITTLDGVADNQLTKLTEIDTAIDTIDAVLDASLVKQTNNETLLTANQALLTSILAKLAPVKSHTTIFNNVTINNTISTSAAIDVRTVKHIAFSGTSSDSGSYTTLVLASTDSAGTYIEVGSGLFGGGLLALPSFSDVAYKYLKVSINKDSVGDADFTIVAHMSS